MDLFASRLRERAAELGIAHAEVARRAGLSERRYSHYVSGIREPDLATLVRIAEALQTTPDALLLNRREKLEASRRTLLSARLNSAILSLDSDDDLETIVLQTEALLQQRRKQRAEQSRA